MPSTAPATNGRGDRAREAPVISEPASVEHLGHVESTGIRRAPGERSATRPSSTATAPGTGRAAPDARPSSKRFGRMSLLAVAWRCSQSQQSKAIGSKFEFRA
jgi:hypothetical protein